MVNLENIFSPHMQIVLKAATAVLLDEVMTIRKRHSDGTTPVQETLAREIGWRPESSRGESLADWVRSPNKTLEECFQILQAIFTKPLVAGEVPLMGLSDDFQIDLYGSKPKEQIQRFSQSVLDRLQTSGLSPKRRMLFAGILIVFTLALTLKSEEATDAFSVLEDAVRILKDCLDPD